MRQLNVPVQDIRINGSLRHPHQDLSELKASLKEHGMLNPITVRECGSDPSGRPLYEIQDGVMRYRAWVLLGHSTIRVDVEEAWTLNYWTSNAPEPCLEPSCPDRAERDEDFCLDHNVRDGFTDYPSHDRDGLALWKPREGRILRMRDMEDGHLVATISMLERAQERRRELLGKVEADPKLDELLKEARRRNPGSETTSCCEDGLVDFTTTNDDEVQGFCQCPKGKAAAAGLQLAGEQVKGRISAILVTALSAGLMFQGGSFFAAALIRELMK